MHYISSWLTSATMVKYFVIFFKEFVGNYDGITTWLLNFNCKLIVGKDVLDISLPNIPVINNSSLGTLLSLQSEAIYGCIIGFWCQVGTHATLEYGEYCLYELVKHVVSHGIKPVISVPSEIYDILSVKRIYINICNYEIGVALSVLT